MSQLSQPSLNLAKRVKRIVPSRTERGVEIGPVDTSFGRRVTIINPSERDLPGHNRYGWRSSQHTFILAFGQVSATYLMVYADSLDDALDECIDWAVDHAPGLLCDDAVKEEFDRLISEGSSEEEAWEEAEVDTSSGGSAGNHIGSGEWTLAAEDLTREELDAFLYDPSVKWREHTHCVDDHSGWLKCHRPVLREAWYPYTASKPALPDADNRCGEANVRLARNVVAQKAVL